VLSLLAKVKSMSLDQQTQTYLLDWHKSTNTDEVQILTLLADPAGQVQRHVTGSANTNVPSKHNRIHHKWKI
jgi:hypothetical protein